MFWSVSSVLCAAIKLALAVRHLRFVLLHAQNGERADLQALPVLIQLRLGELQGLLLHLHVLLRVNEFVIGVRDGGHAGDELLAQALLGVFQPVLGDLDVQAACRQSRNSSARAG